MFFMHLLVAFTLKQMVTTAVHQLHVIACKVPNILVYAFREK